MKLINKYKESKYEILHEYYCEITDELDKLAGLKKDTDGYGWSHYLLYDNYCKKNQCIAIRIPGGTLGSILIDDENRILNIHVATDYVVETYPDDVNEKLRKFVGKTIELN